MEKKMIEVYINQRSMCNMEVIVTDAIFIQDIRNSRIVKTIYYNNHNKIHFVIITNIIFFKVILAFILIVMYKKLIYHNNINNLIRQ